MRMAASLMCFWLLLGEKLRYSELLGQILVMICSPTMCPPVGPSVAPCHLSQVMEQSSRSLVSVCLLPSTNMALHSTARKCIGVKATRGINKAWFVAMATLPCSNICTLMFPPKQPHLQAKQNVTMWAPNRHYYIDVLRLD